jgi:light-harvesting complex I chlorophyll a/b binding protein 4
MTAFVSGVSVSLRSSPFLRGAALSAKATTPRSAVSMSAKSASVPFLDRPSKLDGSMPADFGFDPLGFSNMWDLNFLAEAEIKHGRICMLAMAGWVFPELVYHLPDPAYAQANPLAAVGSVGFLPMAQIFLLCVVMEAISFNSKARNNYENPGNYGWDAFGLMKEGGAKNHYRVAEIKNGRLAMLAIGGAIHHTLITNQSLLEQINSGNWLGGSRPF